MGGRLAELTLLGILDNVVVTLRGLHRITLQNADVRFQLPLLPLLLRRARASSVSRASQKRRVLTPAHPAHPAHPDWRVSRSYERKSELFP